MDAAGETAAYTAAHAGTVTILRHCQGLDFAVRNHEGQTPLEVAIQVGRAQEVIEVITALMQQDQPTPSPQPSIPTPQPLRLICQPNTNVTQPNPSEVDEHNCVFLGEDSTQDFLEQMQFLAPDDDGDGFPGILYAMN